MKTFEWCGEKYVILDKENFENHPKDEVLNLFYKRLDGTYSYLGCVCNPVVRFSSLGRITKLNDVYFGMNVVLAYQVEE